MTAGLLATGLILMGCAVTERPTLEDVRAETDAVLQRVADELPGASIEVRSSDTPYLACSENGTYNYVARWAATPEPDFDGERFVDELPSRLGDDFTVVEGVDVSHPAVGFDSAGVVIDVQVLEADGATVVDLYAISPCGYGTPPSG